MLCGLHQLRIIRVSGDQSSLVGSIIIQHFTGTLDIYVRMDILCYMRSKGCWRLKRVVSVLMRGMVAG